MVDIEQKMNIYFHDLLKTHEDSSYMKDIRKTAFSVFETQGFPTKKMEAWKYTSLNTTLNKPYTLESKEVALKSSEIKQYLLNEDNYRLVFVNGEYQEQLSKLATKDLIILPLAVALAKAEYQEDIEKYFAKIAHEKESLTALNTALATSGAFIKIQKGKAIPQVIELLYITTDIEQPLWQQPRNLILLEEHTEVKIVERHQNLSTNEVCTNAVTEIYTAKDAFVDYYKLQNDNENASLIDNTYIKQETKSHASVHTFSFGGGLTRNNLNFYQEGEHIASTLKGITILNNKQHTDHYTLVKHTQPNCESHQDYKSVLADKSTMAFNGKIIVEKEAQKTNAYQQNDNILVSERATVYTKPQLEIFADDVKCSHGCTIGQLDKKAIFYLQSRGIPKKEAEALLTNAFAHTVVASVKIPELEDIVNQSITEKLAVKKGL